MFGFILFQFIFLVQAPVSKSSKLFKVHYNLIYNEGNIQNTYFQLIKSKHNV